MIQNPQQNPDRRHFLLWPYSKSTSRRNFIKVRSLFLSKSADKNRLTQKTYCFASEKVKQSGFMGTPCSIIACVAYTCNYNTVVSETVFQLSVFITFMQLVSCQAYYSIVCAGWILLYIIQARSCATSRCKYLSSGKCSVPTWALPMLSLYTCQTYFSTFAQKKIPVELKINENC